MSLIFCQIQSMLSILCIICLNSVAPPKISTCHIFTAIICLLGIPFWACDIVLSGLECLTIHLPLLPPNQAQSHISCPQKSYERNQCHRRRHHNSYHKCSRKRGDTKKCKQALSTFDGWASWLNLAQNITQLHHIVSQPLLNVFISMHNPSQIMEVTQLFSIQNEEMHGIVSVPHTKQALISTFEDPRCLSSMVLNSS